MVPLKDIDALEKDTVTFTLELSKPDRTEGIWSHRGEDLPLNEHYTISIDGTTHTLKITDVNLDDQGEYSYSIQNVSTSANLNVSGKWGRRWVMSLKTWSHF